jgi:thiol:disulfide interchange protein DsbD
LIQTLRLLARSAALALLVAILPGPALAAATQDDFLSAEQAYEYVVVPGPDALLVSFNIREGYYLYRKRIGFTTDTPGITLGTPDFPKAQAHHDEYFGDQEIYRGAATFRVPYSVTGARPTILDLHLKLQGCADAGLCYPPQNWLAHVRLPAAAPTATTTPAAGGLLGKLVGSAATPAPASRTDNDFLPVEQAFRAGLEDGGPGRVQLRFLIADGYFLYRGRFRIESESPGITLGTPAWPVGLAHHDEYFGDQEIYRGELVVPVAYNGTATGPVRLKVVYQGCADAGLCYPPQTEHLAASGSASPGAASDAPSAPASEQDRLATLIRSGNLLLVVGIFWGFGFGLSLTPCVLPMVPILAGIIAGDGAASTPARAFLLSVAYVLGMAFTYTAAGVAFAAAGSQAQAVFQQPWILVLFAALFVALALAMFGLYELQMPASVQTRFASASNSIRGGKFISTAVMGALSSLVVTACVAPPLVATYAVIGQAGDVGRGALALLSLSLGMGTPLLVVGASAGRLLPKAGPWMETVKAVFGVLFLGVAAWMLDRLLGPRTMMGVWALVAFAGAYVFWSVGLRAGRRGALRATLAVLLGLQGLVLVASGASGGTDPLRPWVGSRLLGGAPAAEGLAFRPVHSIADLDRELAAAHAAGQRAMLDFYADWCVSCKEMDAKTFRDPAVRTALRGYVLLKADVTANSAEDQALLHRFGIFGPPTTAFFAPDGVERTDFRLVGFKPASAFVPHLQRFEATR